MPHASNETPLIESGDELIERIRNAIVLRRPVLITGPRGSGKSYCARTAIALAIESGEVGGQRFLQGNREIPREYLSEDMLVVRELQGSPQLTLIDALAIRVKEAEEHWTNNEWTVLFLDEINRFGEGFLDSLLSLTEERTIVRAGEELHVPITVVATANPPGYDVTAKKLSPPLQSRMARSYRVAQPTLEALSLVILPNIMKLSRKRLQTALDAVAKKKRATGSNDEILESDDEAERQPPAKSTPATMPADIVSLAAGICLCLWGTPSDKRKGTGFLTQSTVELLQYARRRSTALAQQMDELGELIAFGPDARSAGDWLAAAAALATTTSAASIREEHLLETALETLAHKLRETFNEGVEPRKAVRVGELVMEVTRTVFSTPSLRDLFTPPYQRAANAFFGTEHTSYEVYMLARRLAAVTFRDTVGQLATASEDDTVVSSLKSLSGYRALVALERDYERYLRQAKDSAPKEVGVGQAKDREHRELSNRHERVQLIRAKVGEKRLATSQVRREVRVELTLPEHVARAVSYAFAGDASVSQVHAATRFAADVVRALPVGDRGQLLYRVSPALRNFFSFMWRLRTGLPGVAWSKIAARFGDESAGEALERVGVAIMFELRHHAAVELRARLLALDAGT